MPRFTVLARAVRMLTADIVIEAADAEEARAEVQQRLTTGSTPIPWDEGPVEDKQIESVITEG